MRSQSNSIFGRQSTMTGFNRSQSTGWSKPSIQEPTIVEDDISPYDSVSNWGDEQMEQSFESSNNSPVKMVSIFV